MIAVVPIHNLFKQPHQVIVCQDDLASLLPAPASADSPSLAHVVLPLHGGLGECGSNIY